MTVPQPMTTDPQGTWTNAQAAAFLGCQPNTLRSWVRQGRVPHVRLGRLVRFRPADLVAYLQAHAVPECPTSKTQE